MKLLLTVAVICITQVVWVKADKSLTECCAMLSLKSTSEANVILPGGFYDRLVGEDVNSRPVYKAQSYWAEMYLVYYATSPKGWYVTSLKNGTLGDIYMYNNDDDICPDEVTNSQWNITLEGQAAGAAATLLPAGLLLRCSNCAESPPPNECTDCKCSSPKARIKVDKFDEVGDGYYTRVVGMKSDARPVYKHVESDVYLISQGFFWRLTPNYKTYGNNDTIAITDDVKIQCADDIVFKNENGTTAVVRCSDCSDIAAEYEECVTPCQPCKTVLDGPEAGRITYTLMSSNDPLCTDGCVYSGPDPMRKYCFKEGGLTTAVCSP